LAGVRVLSLAQQFPGPFAGMLLQDLGAEIVMVEQTNGGDPARAIAPLFEALNRGKRSVALDLKTPAGREAFLTLAETARVVLEGFRPGVVERLGIGINDVRRHRPDVVYCSITGYGQDSDDRAVPGHDVSYQARAGAIRIDASEAAAPPAHSLPLADLSAGMFAALSVTAALLQDNSVYIDMSMAESVLALMYPQLALHWAGLSAGAGSRANPAYGIFRTSDGWVSLSVMHEDKFWRSLCQQLGLSAHSVLTRAQRAAHSDALRSELSAVIAQLDTKGLLERLTRAGVPAGRVNDPTTLLDDPLFLTRGSLVREGTSAIVRTPVGRTSTAAPQAAPRLGADTHDLLAGAGYSPERLQQLAGLGVISSPASPASPVMLQADARVPNRAGHAASKGGRHGVHTQ
jgi:crotonobetainyl-CoA:carnitine CoA-transferase CaiB-like acyl-CoA transferase